MRKHLRLVSKYLSKNVGSIGLVCLMIFSITAYLIYFSSSLKNFLKDSNILNFGSLTTSSYDVPYIPLAKQIKYYKNCGMQMPCASGTFSVHLYTGLMNEDLPLICINEKRLPSNKFGRGINVAIFEPSTSTIIRHGNFDVFIDSSDDLEIFLGVLNEGDVAVIVTHDEASSKLSAEARNLLYELGSAYIQDLDYRDVWAFVGQKGITGFTKYEYIEHLLPDYHWSKPINESFCVSKSLKGTILKSDPVSNRDVNAQISCINSKLDSCNVFNNAEESMNEDVDFIAVNNNSRNEIITILIPGPDINIFKMQSEALLLNQELITNNVHVFLPKDEIYLSELAQILKFKVHLLEDSPSFINYNYIFHESLKKAWKLFHDVQYYIILEEGVIPRNDFSDFVTSARKILDKDATVFSASAWNGDEKQSGHRTDSFSRTNIFSGVGIFMKHSSFKLLSYRLDNCCSERSIDGWDLGFPTETIIPRISKVYKIVSPYDNVQNQTVFEVWNSDVTKSDLLMDETFFDLTLHNSLLAQEISLCEILNNEAVISKCLSTNDYPFDAMDLSFGQSHCILYEQKNETDLAILNFLLSCFQSNDSDPIISEGQDIGVFETSNNVFIIGSHSPFFTHSFKDQEPLTMEQIENFKKPKRPVP